MNKPIDISICIPAYKNINYLSRLLHSISVQTFNNYEVIITDDSPDDEVKHFISRFSSITNLKYFRNSPARGTPGNWNESIQRSSGKWIKLIHDDDWFATPDALQIFYTASEKYSNVSFFFCAFKNINQEKDSIQVVKCNWLDLFFLKLSPLHLFKRVYVGNPSCTFIRRDVGLLYDAEFKFVVDFEYYIRCFKKYEYKYLDYILMNIGFNKEQVTKYTFLNTRVQIPENYKLLDKLGASILKNIIVYDYYWRMHRNLNVRSVEIANQFYHGNIHPLVEQQIKFQGRIPYRILKIGLLSKALMIISFFSSLFHQH